MKRIFLTILISGLVTGLYSTEKFEAIREFNKRYKIFFNGSLGGWMATGFDQETIFGSPSVYLSLDYLATDTLLVGGDFFVLNPGSLESLQGKSSYFSYKRIYLSLSLSTEEENRRHLAALIGGIGDYYFDPPITGSYQGSLKRAQDLISWEIGLLGNFLGGKSMLTFFYIDKENYGFNCRLSQNLIAIPVYEREGAEGLLIELFPGWHFLVFSPFHFGDPNWWQVWLVGIDLVSVSFGKVDLR